MRVTNELTGHFGLESSLVTTNVIDRIFDWWESDPGTERCGTQRRAR